MVGLWCFCVFGQTSNIDGWDGWGFLTQWRNDATQREDVSGCDVTSLSRNDKTHKNAFPLRRGVSFLMLLVCPETYPRNVSVSLRVSVVSGLWGLWG